MKYRADIDGLRAIAVIPVVLYHAGVPGFGGGFVGVDIFFVISGYLICGMIDADIRKGSFSLGNFYKRRILRILPALFAMFLGTSCLAYLYFLPVELQDYSRSLASAIGSVSNVYFAQTAELFRCAGRHQTTAAYLVARRGRAVLLRRSAPDAAGLPVRAEGAQNSCLRSPPCFPLRPPWRSAIETRHLCFISRRFAPGSWRSARCCRSGLSRRRKARSGRTSAAPRDYRFCSAPSFIGSPSSPLLVMTSLAGIGATLVIASSERGISPVGRLLSLRPLVFFGLISYSLYLWHWPLMVFQRTDGLLSAESPASARLMLIVISVGIAYLSWKLVETPFRAMARERSKVAVFATASGAMASTLALCGLVLITHGVPSRFPDRVVAIGAYLAYDSSAAMRTGRCFLLTNRQQFDAQTCLTLDPKRPNYLLVGDSHAAHLWFGLASALPEINIMQATASVCRPAARPGSRYETRACRASCSSSSTTFS